ncbi:MAG: PAS domain-containing protein [Deltaproteobacteria bacterium]|nr:PAS domain-containing protein [Deltaproteobacteria bacterium]
MRSKLTKWIDFLDNLPVGVYRSTIEGKFVYCNLQMTRIFGFDCLEDLMAHPVVDLYWEKKDRGNFIQGIMEHGYADDVSLPFKSRQGDPIWCAVTARPVFDEDGIMVYLDGTIRDITEQVKDPETGKRLHDMINAINDLVIILDLDGTMLDINQAGAELLGGRKADLLDRELSDFILEKDRGLFPLFLSEVRKSGRKEAILALVDLHQREHFIEFHAFLVREAGRHDHIRGIARDITDRVRSQSDELVRERFQGVLEMAGGVAHKMNQPLTVVNHLVLEVMKGLTPDSPLYDRIERIQAQIQKLNDIAAKIRGVHRYESMDYVGGVKIVDLDKAS